eukprot:305238-Rhodomonas_salina.1
MPCPELHSVQQLRRLQFKEPNRRGFLQHLLIHHFRQKRGVITLAFALAECRLASSDSDYLVASLAAIPTKSHAL